MGEAPDDWAVFSSSGCVQAGVLAVVAVHSGPGSVAVADTLNFTPVYSPVWNREGGGRTGGLTTHHFLRQLALQVGAKSCAPVIVAAAT